MIRGHVSLPADIQLTTDPFPMHIVLFDLYSCQLQRTKNKENEKKNLKIDLFIRRHMHFKILSFCSSCLMNYSPEFKTTQANGNEQNDFLFLFEQSIDKDDWRWALMFSFSFIKTVKKKKKKQFLWPHAAEIE